MQNLVVTLVQTHQFWEDKKANFELFEELLSEVNHSDLIILPEMFHTGFSMNASVLAEKMGDSEAMNWLFIQSKAKNAAIYTSFIAEENGHYFNRGVFVEPSGEYHVYDKRKTFTLAGETTTFSRGTEERIVNYKGWKINLQICFDLRFPELIRNRVDELGNAAYDLLVYVANWPAKRSFHWSTLLVARAIENQSFVIGTNRIGEDTNGHVYSGDSVCIDALGTSLATCEPYSAEVKQITLEYEHLRTIRAQLPFLHDRDNSSFIY